MIIIIIIAYKGTLFHALGGKVVDANQGQAIAFAGPLRHAGNPICSGTRVILVLFCYVYEYEYGSLIGYYNKNNDSDDDKQINDSLAENSDSINDDPNGYIVYNETYKLMTTLDNL